MASKRGYYRAELLRSITNIEMALTHLSRVALAYEKDHPEISQNVIKLGEVLVMAAETLKDIHDTI